MVNFNDTDGPGGCLDGRCAGEQSGWLPVSRVAVRELVAAYVAARAVAAWLTAAVGAARRGSAARLGGSPSTTPGVDATGRPVVRLFTGRPRTRARGSRPDGPRAADRSPDRSCRPGR